MNSNIKGSNLYYQNNLSIPKSPQKYTEQRVIEQLRLQNEFLKSQINYIITKQAYQNSISNQGYIDTNNILISPRKSLEQPMQISYINHNPNNHLMVLDPNNTMSRAFGSNLTSRQSQMPRNFYRSPQIKIHSPQLSATLSSQEGDFYRSFQEQKSMRQMHRRQISQFVNFQQKGRLTQFKKFTPQNSPSRQSYMIQQNIKTSFNQKQNLQNSNFKKRDIKSPAFLKNKQKIMQYKENKQIKMQYSTKQEYKSKDIAHTRSSSTYQQEVKCKKQKMMNNSKYLKEQKKRSRAPSIQISEQSQKSIERQLRLVMEGKPSQSDFLQI